jgi:uncharacterized protein (DUF1778 family)
MPVSKTSARSTQRPRTERLEARVSREQKQLYQRAATLAGRSLTEFVVNSLQEAARRTIQEHGAISLSRRDQEVFVRALLTPSAPNQQLRRAARAYQAMADR